jgi:hypothetical protein
MIKPGKNKLLAPRFRVSLYLSVGMYLMYSLLAKLLLVVASEKIIQPLPFFGFVPTREGEATRQLQHKLDHIHSLGFMRDRAEEVIKDSMYVHNKLSIDV